MVRKLVLVAALALSYLAMPTATQAYQPIPTCGTASNPCPWVRVQPIPTCGTASNPCPWVR